MANRQNQLTTDGIAAEMRAHGLDEVQINLLGMDESRPIDADFLIAYRQGLVETSSGVNNPYFSPENRLTKPYNLGSVTVVLSGRDRGEIK